MIISSLLDTDLYKFTMQQVVLHHFPAAQVEYRFVCRDSEVDLRPVAARVQQEVEHLCRLSFTQDELDYLRSLPFLTADYIDFLTPLRLNAAHVEVSDRGEQLEIAVRGSWLHTILFEVPLLAIVNECYFAARDHDADYVEGERRLQEKIALIRSHSHGQLLRFSDFGTRRRYTKEWQRRVVERFQSELPVQFIGTSNVGLAKEFAIPAIGTMAHEYIQGCQALGPRLVDTQRFAFDTWAREYRGQLGIALTDTYGIDAFLRDFDRYFCLLYGGVRHDSGDPYGWGDKMLRHYRAQGIDPAAKQLVFSDGLTMAKALDLCAYFVERSQPVFGIGTHLTNDLGPRAISIVIKMTYCNGQPVAKVSDAPGKTICDDPCYLDYLKHVFKIGEQP